MESPEPGDFSQELGARLFAIGAYVGEVIRRPDYSELPSGIGI
jgi:hypothetical protein